MQTTVRRSARAALVLALCLAVPSQRAARAAPAAKPRLCIEYLPAIVYDDEAITLCGRVEAEGGPAAFQYTASLLDRSERVLASHLERGAAKPGQPWRCRTSLRPKSGTPHALLVRLATPKAGSTLASVRVPILSGQARLPALTAKGTRLADAEGRLVLVRIQHRVWERKDTWPLFRWIGHKLYGDTWSVSRALVLGDDLGMPEGGYLGRLGTHRSPSIHVLRVASQGSGASPSALRAVALLSRTALDATPGLALLSLGWREPDVGADVMEFGKTLELIVQQLERRGCERVLVLGPGGPPGLRKRLAPYAAAARRVAHTYDGRFVALAPALTDAHFLSGAADSPLRLRLPNAAGHAALADAILATLKKITR
ncbi:MAG: hypothetical protein ISS72_07590 [Candidatus Brocadiae bacterium]|nr:hypothetical protein [Candidatus Brocadiia bacterium]